MKEETACEFAETCRDTYPGEEMDKYRENCDYINCSLCDRYWNFYDRRVMSRMGIEKDKNR